LLRAGVALISHTIQQQNRYAYYKVELCKSLWKLECYFTLHGIL